MNNPMGHPNQHYLMCVIKRHTLIFIYMVKGWYLNNFRDIKAFYEVKGSGHAWACIRGFPS